ncbi:MAG: ATP-binding protein [Lachnospiraceae bacterium]|nr:ATP-binding protein [Lachnospiraceae bacterium]
MERIRMPIGVDDFKKLRENHFYYVDKTGLIRELLENWGEVNLFTRPRRFGKSMNMSMLKSFFEIGTDPSLFEGLEISRETKLCEEYMGQFPVISISLKQVSGMSYERAEENLRNILSVETRRFPDLLTSDRLDEEDKRDLRKLRSGDGLIDSSLYILSRLLYRHYGRKVIILIDEYDAPLQKAYENGYYEDMVRLIRQLFGYALKSNECLYFSVLTGCTRVSKESIFSDLNNPKLYTLLDERCEERFGFTDGEVRQLLEVLDRSEYYERTREWYDGYRIGKRGIYCPWDVINYCDQLLSDSDKTPRNYWANVRENGIIGTFAEQADSTTRDQIGFLIEGGTVRKKLAPELTYKDMAGSLEHLWSLLFTTGYLTQRARYEDGSYELCIPNREVKNIFTSKIDEWFEAKVLEDTDGLQEFFAALESGDAERLEDCLNYHLGESISYLDGGNYEDKETFYHGLLLGMMNSRRGWEVRSNREAGQGRADIAAFHLRTKDAYVIEVKYCKKESDLQEAVEEALAQIADKEYDRYFGSRQPRSVRHYGIAFCKKLCRVKCAGEIR